MNLKSILGLVLTSLMMSRVKCDTEGRCEKDTTYLADVSGGAPCFSLLDVENGPVVSDVAISTCLDTHSGKGYPVHVRSKVSPTLLLIVA